MNTDEIEQIKQNAAHEYSPEELDNMINLSEKLASKALMHVLERTIAQNNPKAKVLRTVKKVPRCQYSGYLSLEFTPGIIPREENIKQLNVSLGIAPIGFVPEVMVPEEAVNDLVDKYKFIKSVAQTQWLHFVETNKVLVEKICEACPNVDFSALKIDEKNPCSMYFDINCDTRVSIICYYVDFNGRVIR